MVANQHSIKTNFSNSESFIMSDWTSKDVAVRDAAFARLLKVICGETNECSRGVRHVTLYCLFSQTQRPSPRQPPFRDAPNPPPSGESRTSCVDDALREDGCVVSPTLCHRPC